MLRLLFLGATAFAAVRYIMYSNKKQQKLLDEKSTPPQVKAQTMDVQPAIEEVRQR